MKKKIALLVVLTLTFTLLSGFLISHAQNGATAPVFEKIDQTDAVVAASALNMRQGPSTDYDIVSVLKQGQSVVILGKIGDWYAIYDAASGSVGACDSRFLNIPSAVSAPALTPEPVEPAQPSAAAPADISQDEQAMLDLVNKARADAGLTPVAFDAGLMKAARMKAQDMVSKNYFSHQSPTYGSPFDMMRQFDVSFKTAGENIAGNQSVEGAFKAWMSSEGHKKNILNDNFGFIGIGIQDSPTYGKVLVQMFIGR